MSFSNLFFIYLFLAACFICYSAAKKIAHKNIILVFFSLFFYAWGEPVCILLLLFSVCVNYIAGRLIDKFRDTKISKATVVSTLIIDIGMLVVFKYSSFIVSNINAALGLHIPVPDIALPIGISFYTFQTISYTVDCYWEKIKTQKNFLNFLMYVSLFPQLVAGPIVRYSTIEKEIMDRKVTTADLSDGFTRIIIGLSKKVIIANNLGSIADTIFSGDISSLSVIGTWYGAAIYALQVYFDFSGYSDMAIGLGRIFGFHFDENFNHPFICKDITEFWQRWHISLSTFFRDYILYIPVFGKRIPYVNLFLVWLCTGVWHGANWNFIIWGLYFGLFIFIEQLLGKKRVKKIPLVIRHIYNKIVIIIGFGIFYFTDLSRLGDFFKNIVGLNGNVFIDEVIKASFMNNMLLIFAAVLFCFPLVNLVNKIKDKSNIGYNIMSTSKIAVNVILLLVSSIMLVDSTNNAFLYFRF